MKKQKVVYRYFENQNIYAVYIVQENVKLINSNWNGKDKKVYYIEN